MFNLDFNKLCCALLIYFDGRRSTVDLFRRLTGLTDLIFSDVRSSEPHNPSAPKPTCFGMSTNVHSSSSGAASQPNHPDSVIKYESLIQDAAKRIDEADFLLIATGAGFSADSGLPTYTDVAKNPTYEAEGIEYGDLCQMKCLKDRPDLFYGFWGSCFNAYQEHTPHAAYRILKRWCDSKAEKEVSSTTSYYHYTSNVDGHLRKIGFPPDRIHELHGSIDTWMAFSEQVSNKAMVSYDPPPNSLDIPDSFRFPVDSLTLRSNMEEVHCLLYQMMSNQNQSGTTPNSVHRFRPRVLMFDDGFDAHNAMKLHESSERYQAWEAQMENKMAAVSRDDNRNRNILRVPRLTVLEIGCGTRVPSVRQECLDVVVDTAERCQQQQCTFIRINPLDYNVSIPEDVPIEVAKNIHTIGIQGSALDVLSAIDLYLQQSKTTTSP